MRAGSEAADGERSVAAIVQRVTAEYQVGRPFMVGIDGACDAATAALASELAANLQLTASVVSGRDFCSDAPEPELRALDPAAGVERYRDWRRLRDQVLRPTGHGAQLLHYQQFDPSSASLGTWVMVQMPQVVIVEGLYTLRPQLRDLFDVTVYVEAQAGSAEEHPAASGARGTEEWTARWDAAAALYLAQARPDLAADLLITDTP